MKAPDSARGIKALEQLEKRAWHGNLFVSNLPQTTNVAHFKSFFAYWGCHGIDKVSFNPGKRTALVKFQSIREAQWAMWTMDLRRYGATATVARRMIVRPAKNDYVPRQPGLELPSSRLYVTRRTHDPKEVMAQIDLEAWFSSCGDVQEIKVLKSKEHQARGIINMASVHQATYAMEQLNGHTPPRQPGHDARQPLQTGDRLRCSSRGSWAAGIVAAALCRGGAAGIVAAAPCHGGCHGTGFH